MVYYTNVYTVICVTFRMGVLSPDGASKTFDDRANGYARGESACAIFLQKTKDARRIYAKVFNNNTASSLLL